MRIYDAMIHILFSFLFLHSIVYFEDPIHLLVDFSNCYTVSLVTDYLHPSILLRGGKCIISKFPEAVSQVLSAALLTAFSQP